MPAILWNFIVNAIERLRFIKNRVFTSPLKSWTKGTHIDIAVEVPKSVTRERIDRKNMKKNISRRIITYFIGLFLMTIGIALSVKSDLGVSPVSSIPYTMTCVWGLEMGKATILFHCMLVALQILLLRKAFEVKNLLQIAVAFDVSMVVISFAVCFVMIDNVDSVGIGTIIAAVLVGTVHGMITKKLGVKRELFLGNI